MRERPWLALGLSQLLFLVVLAPIVYDETFSVFRFYDDEGYMMLTVKHFLDGHPLYDEVWTLYGPVYYAYKWLVHGFAGLPLTHDVVRLTACAVRLAIGVVASLTAFGLTRSVPLAAASQVLVTTYLTVIRNEPGHPQELASLLTMATVAIPALMRSRGQRAIAVVLGVAIGLLSMVKANLGVFAGVAVWMALLCAARRTKPVVALQIVSGTIVVALPWLFMRTHLGIPQTFDFAAVETAALLALSALTFAQSDGRGRVGDLWWYAMACVATVLLIALGTLLAGTTLHALLDCLVFIPMRMPSLFFTLVFFHVWRPWIGATAVVLALLARFAGRRLPESLVVCAKLVFGIVTCAATWQNDGQVLASVTPLLWLTVLAPIDGRRSIPDSFARLVLCWMTALNPLQIYPVAGSQRAFGTVLHVLCAVVCLGDGVRWLGSYLVTLLGAWVRAAAAGALLLALVAVCVRTSAALEGEYLAGDPLGLPGADRIRLSPPEVEVYRELAAFLRERADVVFSVPGFSSLYFWTGTEPPTLDVIGHVMGFYSDERQTAMVNALLAARAPMVVRFSGLAPPSKSFAAEIDRSFEPVATFGRYQVLARRAPRP